MDLVSLLRTATRTWSTPLSEASMLGVVEQYVEDREHLFQSEQELWETVEETSFIVQQLLIGRNLLPATA